MFITKKRIFFFKDKEEKKELSDPDQSMTPAEVLDFYSNLYPMLLNANVAPPVINDKSENEIEFVIAFADKG